MSKTWMYSFVFSVWCFQGSMPIGVQESNLVKNIYAGHTTDIRPQPNIKDGPTNVNITIRITQILDIDEKNEILSVLAWVNMYWEDMTFTWDPGAYGGVRKLTFPASDIWTPDVILYNTDDIDMGFHLGLPRDDEDQHFFATATANGSIALSFPQVLKSACKLNIGEYPFDTQHCKMQFGSWSHDSSELQIHMIDDKIKKEGQYYIPNKAWQQTGSQCVKATQPCSFDFTRECSVVSCSIDLKRTAWFEIISYTLPTIVIAVLSLMVFMVPPEAGKRMEVGITLILCLAVYLSLVNKKMPSTSEAFPLVTQFYGCIIVEITIAMVCSCYCLHIYDPEGLRLLHFPNYLRTLGFGVLARLICYKTDGGKTSRVHPTSKVDKMDIARRRKSEFKSNGEVFFVRSAQNKQNDFSVKMDNIEERDENNTNNNKNKEANNESKEEELLNKEGNKGVKVVDNGSERSAMINVKKTEISKESKSDESRVRKKQLEDQAPRKHSTQERRKEKSISDKKGSKESHSTTVEKRKESQVPLKEIHRSKGISNKENDGEKPKSDKAQDNKRSKDSASHREKEKDFKREVRKNSNKEDGTEKSEGKRDTRESGIKGKNDKSRRIEVTKKSGDKEGIREDGIREDIRERGKREGTKEIGKKEDTRDSGDKVDSRRKGNRDDARESMKKEDTNEKGDKDRSKIQGNKEYRKEKGTKEDNGEINDKQNTKDNSNTPDGKDTSNKEHKNSTAEGSSKRAKVERRESRKETSNERKKSIDVPQQNIDNGETAKDDEGSKKEKKVKVTDSDEETNKENSEGRRASKNDIVRASKETNDKRSSKSKVSKERSEAEEQSSKQENNKANEDEKEGETPMNTNQSLTVSKEAIEQLQLEEIPEARSEPVLIEENEAETVRVEKRCDSGFDDADGKGFLSNRSSTLSSASVSVPNGSESSHTEEIEEIGQVLVEQDDCEEILKIDRAVTIPLVSRTAGNFQIRVAGMARVTSTLVKANHGLIPKSITARPYTDSVLRRWPARHHSDKRLGSDMQVKKMLFAEIESQSDIEEETTKNNDIVKSSDLIEEGEKQTENIEKENVAKNDLKPHQPAQKRRSSEALVVRRKLSTHNSEVEIDLPIEEAHVDDAPNEVTTRERVITVQEKDSDGQESSKENKEHVIDTKDLFARRNWGVVKAKIRNRFTVQELFGQILSPKETNPIIAIANVVTRDQRKFVMRTEWMTSAMVFNRFFIILLSVAVFISVLAVFLQSSRLRDV